MYVVGQQSPKGGRFALPAKVKRMKIKAVYKRICWVFAALLLSLLCIIESVHTKTAKADSTETVYSNVMDDLQKDDTFDPAKYPEKANNHSLQVITIAESANYELFVYVYQPNATHTAVSINISTAYYAKEYQNYTLTLLSSEGVFSKYVVNDFVVSNTTVRYYEISSIFRKIDIPLVGNWISEASYAVGKRFEIDETKGTFAVYDIDLIEVVSKYVGLVRYIGDYNFWGTEWHCDSHYVAFSTDRDIDKLYEADIYFKSRSARYQEYGNSYEYGSYATQTVHLNHEQEMEYDGGKFSYLKERIQTVDEFIKTEKTENKYDAKIYQAYAKSELTEEGLNDLQGKEWVVRFYESEYKSEPGFYGGVEYYTEVSDVSILRLKFETDGVVYNLGVVDNKQTSDGNPDNETKVEIDPDSDWIVELFAWIFLGLGLWFIFQFIKPVKDLFVWIFKGLWWLICLPFKLLGLLFKKRK